MPDFKSGAKLKLTNGEEITIKSKIGEGGQGAVYKVSLNGTDLALKWYLPNYLKGLKPDYKQFSQNLSDNVTRGKPSDAFLWQKAIAANNEGFGYIMDLRPTRYEEFTKFIKTRVKFSSTEAVIRAAIHIVEAFQALHRQGLSYQDLSPGNFFIDKDTGDVLICDNDNVAPDGVNLGVGGTPSYIAPEIILGKDKPCTKTDLFSLSVILFELFFFSHPLDGANCCRYPCLTRQIEKELYAINPIFVMSKSGKNAPVRGVHSNLIKLWPTYPDYLHEAFEKAFEAGMKDGNKRLSEGDWKKVLYRLIDESISCPKCKELNFASMGMSQQIKCIGCGNRHGIPFKAIVNGFEIYASVGRRITEYHLSFGDYRQTVATFVESKKNPGVFGIKNDSNAIWSVNYPGKATMTYEPGKVVTMIPETTISIGNNTIQIEE